MRASLSSRGVELQHLPVSRLGRSFIIKKLSRRSCRPSLPGPRHPDQQIITFIARDGIADDLAIVLRPALPTAPSASDPLVGRRSCPLRRTTSSSRTVPGAPSARPQAYSPDTGPATVRILSAMTLVGDRLDRSAARASGGLASGQRIGLCSCRIGRLGHRPWSRAGLRSVVAPQPCSVRLPPVARRYLSSGGYVAARIIDEPS